MRLHSLGASRDSGFTLLELVVVIFIIGVMATFVSLSIGSRPLEDKLDTESRRVEELIKLGLEEAEMKGIPLGLDFTAAGYRFLAIDEKHHWSDYAGSDILRPRQLSDPFFALLSVEGRPVPIDKPDAEKAQTEEEKKKAQDKFKPQVLLLPGGEATAFVLELHAPGYRPYYRIEASALGKVEREREDGGR